jgi:hypothetical protein
VPSSPEVEDKRHPNEDDKWRRLWKQFRERRWDDVRDSWVEHIPSFGKVASRPDPGLENLPELLSIARDEPVARHEDVYGLRTNALWEAMFLFHKCSHTNLAAQRLASQGMHSWCLFNAYHSAYLGAKGIMTLLGVPLPNLSGNQVGLDLFPEPEKKRLVKPVRFDEFLIVRLPKLDQRRMWQGFQRLLKMCRTQCWDDSLRKEIINVAYSAISPPRNYFLYKSHYWPLEDLASDATGDELSAMMTPELDAENDGFLLRLSFLVYLFFQQLISDLAKYSPVIRVQLEASRCLVDVQMPELDLYREFISQVAHA